MNAEFRATFVLTLRQLAENNNNDTYNLSSVFWVWNGLEKWYRKAITGTAATLCLSDLSSQETTNGAILSHEVRVLSFEATPWRGVAAFHLEDEVGEKSKDMKDEATGVVSCN